MKMIRIFATLAAAEGILLRRGKSHTETKMCMKSRMESQMCMKAPMGPELTMPVQVLKGARDACAHCRDFQCSPGLCYAGPCPQGLIDSNVNPDCLVSDYCWNPAPVAVRGTTYKMCFLRGQDGGHGLSIAEGKVIADNSLKSPISSVPVNAGSVPSQSPFAAATTASNLYGSGQNMHINSAPPSYINYNIPGVAQPTQPMINQFGGSIPGTVNPYSMPAALDSVGNSQNRANYQSMSANQQTSQFSQQSSQLTTPQTFPITQQSSGFADISSGQQQPAQSALTAIAQGSGMITAPQPTMLSSQTMQQNMGFTR